MRARTTMPGRRLLLAGLLATTAGCAALALRDPVAVHVAGLEPIAGEGLETRFLLKLRVQNPNDTPIEYDGLFVELEVSGTSLASGVSDRAGVVPRFGEQVIAVPVTVPVGSIIRQAIGLATRDRPRLDYLLRGRLAGPGFGGVRFQSKGELQLPDPASPPVRR